MPRIWNSNSLIYFSVTYFNVEWERPFVRWWLLRPGGEKIFHWGKIKVVRTRQQYSLEHVRVWAGVYKGARSPRISHQYKLENNMGKNLFRWKVTEVPLHNQYVIPKFYFLKEGRRERLCPGQRFFSLRLWFGSKVLRNLEVWPVH